MKKLSRIHEEFEQEKRIFSLCILDVDHFKQVNDHYGHLTGDRVLIGLADEMRAFFDSETTLARFGGEEFIILLPDCNQQEAYEKVDAFREHVKHQTWDGVSVTISMGVSGVSSSRTVNDIIVGADSALYKAKHEGRDRVKLESDSQRIEDF